MQTMSVREKVKLWLPSVVIPAPVRPDGASVVEHTEAVEERTNDIDVITAIPQPHMPPTEKRVGVLN